MPESHTIDQAAQIAGCSSDTVRRAIQSGALPATKPGGSWGNAWAITGPELHRWVESRKGKGSDRGVWTGTDLWPTAVCPKGGQFTPTPRGVVARFTLPAVSLLCFLDQAPCEPGDLFLFRLPSPLRDANSFPFVMEVTRWAEGWTEARVVDHDFKDPLPTKEAHIRHLAGLTICVPEGVEIPPTGSEVAVDIMEREFRIVACPRPQHGPRYVGGMIQPGEQAPQEVAARPQAAFIIGALLMGPVMEKEEQLRGLIRRGWEDCGTFGTVAEILLREFQIPEPETKRIMDIISVEKAFLDHDMKKE